MDFNAVFLLKLSQRFPRKRLGKLLHQLVPCDCFGAVVLADHGDAILNRTDEEAEPTADAIVFADAGLGCAVMRCQVDALVSAVLAGNVAEVAVDAL